MGARMMRSRGDDLAGAADVDELQVSQLEVNVTLTAGEFPAERLVKRGPRGYVGYARHDQASLSRERANAQRHARHGVPAQPVRLTVGHYRVPTRVTRQNKSYNDIITTAYAYGHFRTARKPVLRYDHRRRG
jgi:hypothetical protein